MKITHFTLVTTTLKAMFLRAISTGLLVVLLAGPHIAYAQAIELPDMGGVANAPSPEHERRTGQAVMRNLRRAGALIEDLLANAYLNNLGYQLLSAHRQPEHEFHFFLVNDNSINAFALPGGYIGINYGLILSSQSEDELAAVLAHEIAHVTQKHHSRAYAQQSSSQIPILAAIIAAAVLGDSQAKQAAIASSLAIQAEQQLSFTRANEREADRIGIALLADAGFNPLGMADFFKRLDEQSRLYGPTAPEFLRTHPVNVNRITDAHHRARQHKVQPKNDAVLYQLIRARLQVLGAEQPAEAVRHFQQLWQATTTPSLATHYGYLLALLENRQYQDAYQIALKFDAKQKQLFAIKLAILRAELHTNPDKAIKQYRKLLPYYPNHPALIHDYVEALLTTNAPMDAQNLLNRYLKKHSDYPVFFKLLARVESILNNPADSHQAMAEYYYQIGQLHQAIQQIELALKQSHLDFYQLSKLEARKTELKDELLQLKDLQNN